LQRAKRSEKLSKIGTEKSSAGWNG